MSPMLASIKSFIGGCKSNRKGSNLAQKLIIFESDDWGAIRTPSAQALRIFEQAGMDTNRSLYKYDALESTEDLEALFEVLAKHTGADGKPAKFTANAIMANPDFEAIRESNFQEYHYQTVEHTFAQYPQHQKSLQLWKEGHRAGLFVPQFHGREHLNIDRWMRALRQESDKSHLHLAFRHGATFSGKDDYSFMEAFDWDQAAQVEQHAAIIRDGIQIFHHLLGFQPQSFIAPCYNWDTALENSLHEQGIRWIQGLPSQLAPTGTFNAYQAIPHYFGQHNACGQRYNVRNVIFEPTTNQQLPWEEKVMGRIAAAFLFNKPAVICTHRVNYIGYIDPENRTKGLKRLDNLLKKITKQWPDAIFASTDELDNYLTI
jgi:hypothetical protein